MPKFISWNIDSLNAALTSDSPRAQLSRDVLNTLKEEDADFIAIQETKLPPGGPARKHTKALEEFFPGYVKAHIDRGIILLEQEARYGDDILIHLTELEKGI